MIDKEQSNLKKKKIKKILLVAIIALVVSIILISGSMAYYKRVVDGNKKYVITASSVTLVLDETSNDITIANTLPQTDEDGMTNSAYTFSIENMGSTTYQYTIYLEDNEIEDGATRVSDEFIKYYLTNDSLTTQKAPALLSSLSTDENGRILETGTIAGSTKYNYTLRFWVDYDATQTDAAGKAFSVRLNIIAKQKYENLCISAVNGEDTSNAEAPRLTSGMIPVVYDECEKTWKKADVSESWYNYDTQNWANAVTVTEATRQTYMDMDAGEPISMDDINTMWVWIPRYEYQYTDLGTNYAGGTQAQPGEIKINFISSDTIVPSDNTKYQIPEGFTFGEENIPGFWMGKYETSTLEECTAAGSDINTGCDLTTLTPQIKPNVTSWRGARVSTFFEASRLMQSSDDTLTYNADTYGFDIEGTSSMDSHMLKNTEWGIVAMLSQSKYGKYGNSNYTGVNKELYQNKSSSFITGMSNETPSTSTTNTQVTYDTEGTGYGASTTGTIYGVYDMSGGSWEYVMGNYNNYSGDTSYNSGFCGTNGPTDGTCREWPNAKYIDVYTSNTASSAYKFGDGTYETSGWYSDSVGSATSDYPWLYRGGSYSTSTIAGVFSSGRNNGKSAAYNASRFAIKP